MGYAPYTCCLYSEAPKAFDDLHIPVKGLPILKSLPSWFLSFGSFLSFWHLHEAKILPILPRALRLPE